MPLETFLQDSLDQVIKANVLYRQIAALAAGLSQVEGRALVAPSHLAFPERSIAFHPFSSSKHCYIVESYAVAEAASP